MIFLVTTTLLLSINTRTVPLSFLPMPTACSPPPRYSGTPASSSKSICWTRFVCVCSQINLCNCTSYRNYVIWLNTAWANEMRVQKEHCFYENEGKCFRKWVGKEKVLSNEARKQKLSKTGGGGRYVLKRRIVLSSAFQSSFYSKETGLRQY